MYESTYAVPYLYDRIYRKPFSFDRPLAVQVPGSKSITNRALLLATLAEGSSTLRGALSCNACRTWDLRRRFMKTSV